MTYAGPDTWTLTIPDINTFYGITKPGVTVEKLAFVFRNADSSREGKGEGGTDIFVDVLPAGFQLVLTSTLSGPVATLENVTVQHGVVVDGEKGLEIHAKINILNANRHRVQVVAWFYYADGEPLMDIDGQYRAGDGQARRAGTDDNDVRHG